LSKTLILLYGPDPARVVTTGGNLDTGGEVGSSGGERDEARGAGGGARERPEPGGEPLEVDRGRGRDVLQVRLGQAAVAATAQPEGAQLIDKARELRPVATGTTWPSP
jgi:hypothetical protein